MASPAFLATQKNENELTKGTINVLLQLCVWYPLLNSTFALAYVEIFISWDADSDWIPKEKIEKRRLNPQKPHYLVVFWT